VVAPAYLAAWRGNWVLRDLAAAKSPPSPCTLLAHMALSTAPATDEVGPSLVVSMHAPDPPPHPTPRP
jgi:hypothetical protein